MSIPRGNVSGKYSLKLGFGTKTKNDKRKNTLHGLTKQGEAPVLETLSSNGNEVTKLGGRHADDAKKRSARCPN